MTTLANALALACFLAACFRARWVALALAPAAALILASWMGLVDLSSASHPARWLVPLVGAALAGWAACAEQLKPNWVFVVKWWLYLTWTGLVSPIVSIQHIPASWASIWRRRELCKALWLKYTPGDAEPNKKAIVAALLVFGSDAVDLVALHPKIWGIPGTWAITPIQIIVCVSILVVLMAPERWVVKWVK